MSTFSRAMEARVSALERRQINTDARIEEVNEETTASLKHLSDDMAASFRQVSEYFGRIEETMATKEDITRIEGNITRIEETMATKEDITRIEQSMVAMETRILDAFKQLLTAINTQGPSSKE